MNEDFYTKSGKKIDKSLNFIGKIEVAFSKPGLDTLIDIAEGLDITVSKLTHFDEN